MILLVIWFIVISTMMTRNLTDGAVWNWANDDNNAYMLCKIFFIGLFSSFTWIVYASVVTFLFDSPNVVEDWDAWKEGLNQKALSLFPTTASFPYLDMFFVCGLAPIALASPFILLAFIRDIPDAMEYDWFRAVVSFITWPIRTPFRILFGRQEDDFRKGDDFNK
jgi:hypothetical protein